MGSLSGKIADTQHLRGELSVKNGVDGKSAYEYAKDGGYTGTEAEFAKKLSTEWASAEELSQVQEEIAEQIGEVVLEENMTDAFDFMTGFLNRSGNPVSFTYGGITDFIPVNVGDVFVWTGESDKNSAYEVCVYDKNKNFIKGYSLIESSYVLTRNVMFTVTEGTYVRFSSVYVKNASLIKTKEYDGITELVNKTDEYLIGAENGFIVKDSSSVDAYSDAIVTPFIEANENDVFLVTCFATSQTVGVSFYDLNNKYIKQLLYNSDGSDYIANREKVIAPKGTAYVRFSSFYYNSYPLKVWKYEQLPLKHADYQLYEYIKELRKSNVLFGKKYVACGDSFTAGDFSVKNEETWDEKTGEYKTYDWHIADRNKMVLFNDGRGGSTMYNNGDANAFSVTRYTEVPTDADYITLCFGLNETNATIGTLEDTTNETVIGAWNIVLEYLITNMPYAKIGIIISDAWLSSALREALIDVAEYWGIPYLDLKGDTKVPMLIGGRMGTTVSAKAMELRNNAFQVSTEDSHPNPKAHLYRSTIIENFLRSL